MKREARKQNYLCCYVCDYADAGGGVRLSPKERNLYGIFNARGRLCLMQLRLSGYGVLVCSAVTLKYLLTASGGGFLHNERGVAREAAGRYGAGWFYVWEW